MVCCSGVEIPSIWSRIYCVMKHEDPFVVAQEVGQLVVALVRWRSSILGKAPFLALGFASRCLYGPTVASPVIR